MLPSAQESKESKNVHMDLLIFVRSTGKNQEIRARGQRWKHGTLNVPFYLIQPLNSVNGGFHFSNCGKSIHNLTLTILTISHVQSSSTRHGHCDQDHHPLGTSPLPRLTLCAHSIPTRSPLLTAPTPRHCGDTGHTTALV